MDCDGREQLVPAILIFTSPDTLNGIHTHTDTRTHTHTQTRYMRNRRSQKGAAKKQRKCTKPRDIVKQSETYDRNTTGCLFAVPREKKSRQSTTMTLAFDHQFFHACGPPGYRTATGYKEKKTGSLQPCPAHPCPSHPCTFPDPPPGRHKQVVPTTISSPTWGVHGRGGGGTHT